MINKSVIIVAISVVLGSCGSRQAKSTGPSSQPMSASTAQPAPPPAADAQPAAPPSAEPAPPVNYVRSGTSPAPQPPLTPAPTAGQQPNGYPVPGPAGDLLSIPAGTVLRVRLDQTLDTRHNHPGDGFTATVVRRISENGTTVIPAGTRCYGHLVAAKSPGRFKGRAVLSLRLDSFALNGKRYTIATSTDSQLSRGHKKRNWVLMGGGSGVGAAIGAVAGGGFGALIGAGAGGAAGTVGAAITGKKNVRLPVETVLAFSLRQSVPVAE